MFKWDLVPFSWAARDNGDVLIGVTNKVGRITGHNDDGTDISWAYRSPWFDFGEQVANRIKILKRIGTIIETGSAQTIAAKWFVDFDTAQAGNYTLTLSAPAAGFAEWNLDEWNVAEFGGATFNRFDKRRARASGQYFQTELSGSANAALTLLQLELFMKIGRVA